MNNREFSPEEISDIAFMTTNQSHNSELMAHHYGKLTSLKFGRAIIVIRNQLSTNIQHLRDEIYAPKNLGNVHST